MLLRLFGCLLLLLAAMPQAAAQSGGEEEAGPDCTTVGVKFKDKFKDADKTPNNKVKDIQIRLFSAGYHPGRIDGLLGGDTYTALGQFCRSRSKGGHLNPNDLATSLEDLLKEMPDLPAREISLSGGGCGCSRSFKENSLVYGFYPHWLADGKEHVLDFSLFDRIGFFALELNRQGAVEHELQWPSNTGVQPNVADFISQAHKHMVEVDVIFRAASWQNWDSIEINRATDIIVDTVTRKYKNEVAPVWRKHVSADGVNLFFDDYANSATRENWRKLLKFVNRSPVTPEDLESRVRFVNEQAKLAGKPPPVPTSHNLPNLSDEEQNDLVKIISELAGERQDGRELLRIENGFAVSEYERQLVDIVEALNWKLRLVESDVKFNIMLGLNLAYVDKLQLDANKVSPTFEEQYQTLESEFRILELHFKSLAKILDAEPKKVDNVFVFLTQDTSKSKKNLRQIIENAFTGAARQTILRKTVPIVVAQGLAEQKATDEQQYREGITQFRDDLIYMQNNFAGIGLWHLPLTPKKGASEGEEGETEVAENEDVAVIREALEDIYQTSGEFALLGEAIEPYANELCEIVCPNRWSIRYFFDFLLALAALYALLALRNCRLREFYRRRFVYFAGYGIVTAAIFAATLVCDPYWRQRAVYVLVGILLLIGSGYVAAQVKKKMQPPLP